MPRLALILNPQSRQNRRDPGNMQRLAAAMGDTGQVHSPDKQGLPGLVRALADQPPAVLAIHGGDGTVHYLLSSLIPAFAQKGKPLPPLVLLTGGTMNVIPRSLDLVADPLTFLAGLAARVTAGRPIETVSRRCLSVGDRFGFVFANGAFASFLEHYYETSSYGAGRAFVVAAHAVASSLVGGAYARRTFRPYQGSAIVDGEPLPETQYTSISAATVSQIGMGFKLHHRADEDLDRFSMVAVRGSPASLLSDLASVKRGQGIDARRALTRTATRLRLIPEGQMTYTVDGDLYRTDEPLDLALGPTLRLVRPG